MCVCVCEAFCAAASCMKTFLQINKVRLIDEVKVGEQRKFLSLQKFSSLSVSLCVDLRWVQVSSAEEAYKVMKLGKKNQSFSSTKLNWLSSRRSAVLIRKD